MTILEKIAFVDLHAQHAPILDEIHVAISPILLGSGEHLFANLDTLALGYHCAEHMTTTAAMHCVLTKRS